MVEHDVDRYARDVVDGRVPAGKYHRLACARHVNDRSREGRADFPFVFRIEQAERFFRFAGMLKHYKGEWAGQPIALTDFQRFRLGCVFGWRHVTTGLRRFTTAYNELPRKQGKSLEAAVVSIYVTFFEGEPGAEGYCIATKEKQAADLVFRDIKRLIQSSGLKDRLKVQVKNVHHLGSASKLEPLGSDSETLDGLNPHSITTDELHAFKSRGLLDVMESATGARRNPLHYQITTAGDDPVSVCGDQHDYACKILSGALQDFATESFFACIAHADVEDDWQAESTWRKANPHYGISVKPDDLLKAALKAKNMPSAAAEFKQKRLNLWVNATAPCLSVDGWRQGQTRDWSHEDLRGQPCYVGVDLGKKIDLAGVSFVFPPTASRASWRLVQKLFTPADTLLDRAHRDRAPYDVWRTQGWLQTSGATEVQTDDILQAILCGRAQFEIQQIGFDPWHAHDLKDALVKRHGFAAKPEENGPLVLDVPQTYQGMSAACLEMQALILSSRVDAGGCPVTAWAVSNVVANTDGKENLMFAKGKSRGRIDPVIAATIGLALKMRQPEPEENVYLNRGVLSLADFLS